MAAAPQDSPRIRQHLAGRGEVYVSVTGLRAKRGFAYLRFWRHTLPSIAQARGAAGLLFMQVRRIGDVHHTLTVWESRAAMLAYMRSGAHLKAMRASTRIGSGKVFGYPSATAPSWDEALAALAERGRTIG